MEINVRDWRSRNETVVAAVVSGLFERSQK